MALSIYYSTLARRAPSIEIHEDRPRNRALRRSSSTFTLHGFVTSSSAPLPGPQPDPFLQKLLSKGKAEALSGLISRVPVTVYVDATGLTVGGAETINTAGWDADQVLAATLQGLSREMRFAPSISDAQSLPMVR